MPNLVLVPQSEVLCVLAAPPNLARICGWTDQIWHAYADGPGDGSYLKKIDLPTQGGVEVGILGGQKIKSPGNVMNCPDNQ